MTQGTKKLLTAMTEPMDFFERVSIWLDTIESRPGETIPTDGLFIRRMRSMWKDEDSRRRGVAEATKILETGDLTEPERFDPMTGPMPTGGGGAHV